MNLPNRPRSIGSAFVLAATVSSMNAAAAQNTELPGGFAFGSTLDEAHITAEAKGWALEKLDPLPNTWTITGSGLSLTFCDGVLGSIDQTLPGGLVAFVDEVSRLRLEHGEPEMRAVRYSAIGGLVRSIDSVFQLSNQHTINVQVYSDTEKTKTWSRISDDTICNAAETTDR